VKKARFLYFR